MEQNNDDMTNQLHSNEAKPESQIPENISVKSKKSYKNKIGLVVVLLLLVGIGISALRYRAFIAEQNKPENIFKKAAYNFYTNPKSMTATGKIDQGGVNAPDYNFILKTDQKGSTSSELTISDFIISPKISYQNISGTSYVNFTNILDSKALAAKYKNSGKPGLAEELAKIADTSKLSSNQDTWLEVPYYLLQSGSNPETNEVDLKRLENVTPVVGVIEQIQGVSARKYDVSLAKADFLTLVSQLSVGNMANPLSTALDSFAENNGMIETIPLQIWVTPQTKKIVQISYKGRAFKDATMELNIVTADNKIEAPAAKKITKALGFGVISELLFSKNFQSAKTENDKERYADLKGIKAALEIFKSENGYYPDSYSIAVGGNEYIKKYMPGASLAIFKDPNDRLIGYNGSQYAYVPQDKDGKESCVKSTCQKFFIITTLDTGLDFQLNSDE